MIKTLRTNEPLDNEISNGDGVFLLADPDDGVMDEVHALRDQYGADVAVLFQVYNYAGGHARRCTALYDTDAFGTISYLGKG